MNKSVELCWGVAIFAKRPKLTLSDSIGHGKQITPQHIDMLMDQGVIGGAHPYPALYNRPAEAGLEQTPYIWYSTG